MRLGLLEITKASTRESKRLVTSFAWVHPKMSSTAQTAELGARHPAEILTTGKSSKWCSQTQCNSLVMMCHVACEILTKPKTLPVPTKWWGFCKTASCLALEIQPLNVQEGSRDLQKGYPSVTKGASSSAKHPSKVPFTKAWRGLHLRKASRELQGGLKEASRGFQGGFKGLEGGFKGAAWRGLDLEGNLKGASRGLEAFNAEGGFGSPPLRRPQAPSLMWP